MYKESFADGELSALAPPDLSPDAVSKRSSFIGFLGTVMSLLLLFVAAAEYRNLNIGSLEGMLPSNPIFWLAFVACYLTGPVGDWVIFRRLWQIPLSGLAPLIRKLVSNELVFGYLGEAQFYTWARARAQMTAAPFGAIKDVALLSALVGNLATLLLMVASWSLLTSEPIGTETHRTFLSLGAVLVTSFAMFLFRQKLFTLRKNELYFIAAVHSARTAASLFLGALLWHLALPRIALSMWLVMAALRMLVSRLPFVPNKDLVFAGFAVFLLGHEPQVGALMTMMAALMLAAHIIVGAVFAIIYLARIETAR